MFQSDKKAVERKGSNTEAKNEESSEAVLPWILRRDNRKPDTVDIDFFTLVLENEFR